MKKLLEKLGHSWIALGAILALSVFFFFLPISKNLEMDAYDARLKHLRGSKYTDKIGIIAIDQTSLDKLGSWPWDRTRYVELISNLRDNKPDLLVFDILFQEPKQADKKFEEAIKNAGFDIILPYSFVPVSQFEVRAAPVVENLEKASTATGFIDYIEDPDKVVRRVRLAMQHNGEIYPSLDLVAFALINKVSPDDIKYEKEKIIVGDIVIPTNEGYVLYIDYYIPKSKGMVQNLAARSFYKLYDPKKITDLSGVTLILGAWAPGMRDDFHVPAQPKMYGAKIHANVINTMMTRGFIKKPDNLVNVGIVLLLILVYGLLLSRVANVKILALVSVGILIIFSAINFYFFKAGIWLNWVQPAFVIFSGALVISALQFFRTRKLFGQFVAKEVVDQMVASDKHSKMGGVEKEVSILFSDIRGYTDLSENMTPTEVIDMLNEYHAAMVKIFHKYEGRVFDYMGDAQMVVFGAPIEREDHALLACKAALDMNDALDELREKWRVENREQFEIGIGVCTGIVAIGIVGAEGAKQYSAIGDTTNVASRLQGQSKVLNSTIIISPTTYEYVKEDLETRSLGEVSLKGKIKPVEVFTVMREKESTGQNRKKP
ncbi:MAG: adenylate/guanylate cyclase domain-containing protein [Candidatus Eremiobacteraeota bacterium]|nr:adenylate/guanylate cyclase domain-containing protein [Candidatus Eremiobacteraeota bacterium]